MTITQLRAKAKAFGKDLVYNRSLGAYQIVCGFESSLPEYPSRNENGRLSLSTRQISNLFRAIEGYIN